MSEAERQDLSSRGAAITVDEIRELTGAATPHFAQQIRNRVARLIADLPADNVARLFGEAEITRLTELSLSGEVRGTPAQPGMPGLPSTTIPH